MHLAEFSPPPVGTPSGPLPPKDRLPVKEFLGTGSYSDGACLISPYEEIIFLWRPDKQPIRQLCAKTYTQDNPQALPSEPSPQVSSQPEGQLPGEGGEEISRSDREGGEVLPFCNYRVYAM